MLKTLFLSFEDIDWKRTQAYSLGNVGQIYLNVVGREPYGCVRPGAEYEQVRDDIIARLQELQDPETGELVVETIYRREEIYHGEYLEQAPDIVFLPRNLEYFGFRRVRVWQPQDHRTDAARHLRNTSHERHLHGVRRGDSPGRDERRMRP